LYEIILYKAKKQLKNLFILMFDENHNKNIFPHATANYCFCSAVIALL